MCGVVGSLGWERFPLELLSHFRIPYLLIGTGALGYFVWRKTYLLAFFALISLLFNGASVLPYFIHSDPSTTVSGTKIRVLSGNLSFYNSNSQAFLKIVKELKPQIVAVSEMSPWFEKSISSLKDDYPFVFLPPQGLLAGPALYSQFPIEDTHFHLLTIHLEASVQIQNKRISLFNVTSPPPLSATSLKKRDTLFEILLERLQFRSSPQVILGDFNTSPWSSHFKDFITKSTLSDARLGFGIVPTWPSFLPFFGIPIDYCLVSKDVRVLDFHSIKLDGSDHRLIVCDLGV